VTNYHVIQGANKVQVTLHNGETYPASIVGGNNDMDIAVIKINANDLKPAKVGDSSTVEVGDTAVAIGNPLGQLGGTATTGIISALDRNLTIEGRTLSLMQTDAAINGGNSGGGLFNSKGELIGIVDAKSSGVGIEGLAFALPINSVVDDIDDIIENGNVSTRPVVGVTIADVSEDTARYYQLESAGVYITQVTGENAKKAGFQSEDRIVSLDGEEITSSQQFVSAVRKHKAGDIVTIVVSRSGQEIEIKTELEEYTDNNL
jgi:serine protease Do